MNDCRSASRGTRWKPTCVVIGSFAMFLSGCSSAPSRNILGSYFPSWMICAVIGMCATVAVRGLLVKVGVDKELPAPIVVYLALAVVFSLGLWLLWLA
jgi:hypothetical protein